MLVFSTLVIFYFFVQQTFHFLNQAYLQCLVVCHMLHYLLHHLFHHPFQHHMILAAQNVLIYNNIVPISGLFIPNLLIIFLCLLLTFLYYLPLYFFFLFIMIADLFFLASVIILSKSILVTLPIFAALIHLDVIDILDILNLSDSYNNIFASSLYPCF